MPTSLSARIIGIGLIVVASLGFLAGLLADASARTSESFGWVTHSAEVIEAAESAISDLREAESGQHDFVLTRSPVSERSVSERLDSSARSIAWVVHLTADNPLQHARAYELAAVMKDCSVVLRHRVEFGRRSEAAGTISIAASGRGRELMDALTTRAQVFLEEERRLQTDRSLAAQQRLVHVKWLAILGASVVVILVLVGFAFLIRGIRRPLATIMRAMDNLGSGERDARIETAMGSREFGRLALGYNAMVDRLVLAVADREESERQLRVANAELQRNGETLRERGAAIELLGGMAHRMQAARTDEELAAVVRAFVPRVLPDLSGALYAYNNSRNLLAPIAGWGGDDAPLEGFAPDQCWALRRGQSHRVVQPGCDVVCGHAGQNEAYHCEPLLAGGEVIGVLHLRGTMSAEGRFRLMVLTENIASALVNQRLQRSLREQTIRDPLTGLFNRRYMEEALTLEIARASRSGAPLSVVMCDVDHFKRFNDEFGHDAGDAVLQAVGGEMRDRFRDGDVVCRYGGEEFVVIAPGTGAVALAARVDTIRQAIGELNVRQNGRTLGSTSMSFGIATWTDGMGADGSRVLQAADAALYEAKRAGRNRTTVARLAA